MFLRMWEEEWNIYTVTITTSLRKGFKTLTCAIIEIAIDSIVLHTIPNLITRLYSCLKARGAFDMRTCAACKRPELSWFGGVYTSSALSWVPSSPSHSHFQPICCAFISCSVASKYHQNDKQSKSLTLTLQKACLYRHPNYSLCTPRRQAGVKLPAHLSVAVPKPKQICLQDLQAKPYAFASRTRNWRAYLDRLSKHLAC